MNKSAEAFRTIGEVADELDVPKHVLRFWEGKFPHIRPMKRGGGRRYYRPEDMELLRGIRHLLHAEGYTIKGVQKILREQGVDQVKAAAIAAGAVLAAKAARVPKTKARSTDAMSSGRLPQQTSAKADAVAASGDANPKSKNRPDAARRMAPAGTPPATHSTKDIVAAAIRELEICRQILSLGAAKPVEAGGARLRAARS